MKRFVMAVALACVVSGTALAGNVPTSDVATPQPPPNPVVTVILAIVSVVVY